MQLVPTPAGRPNARVRVALSGSTYTILWLWNARDRAWTFSISDADGVPLLSGVRVVLNVDLLATAAPSTRRPPYPIFVVDPTNTGVEPDLESLGGRVKVVYAESS